MSSLKKIVALIAVVAIMYFAPQLGPFISSFLHVSAFLGAAIGSVIVAASLSLISAVLLTPGKQGSTQTAGTVVVKLAEATRWICAGSVRQGGAVQFAEFHNGELWFIIVHCDSILTNPSEIQYYLDDVAVTVDGSGYVQDAQFRLLNNKKKDPATTMGEGDPYVQLWTTTYSETNPTPSRIAALDAAFPSLWTSNHKLVGTTFTVCRIKALTIDDRYKIYKWRGPLGLGEPAVSIFGRFSNVYDPRDGTQTLGNRATYKPTDNAALIWAWFRTHPYGRRKSEASINWAMIGTEADICDQSVVGIAGTVPRYECGIAIPDDKQRVSGEQEIMLTSDAQIVFDEDGKTWIRVGAWYNPTLAFSRNRDILAMESVEAQNGESETQGVVVRYSEPAAGYMPQPSAAWLNPNYYVPGTAPRLLTVDILACHDHNQAMRLAKAIGMRSQPVHKIGPTVGLRGLRARQERIVAINYDNTFAGDYEIATPVEIDANGIFVSMGLVPVDSNRWTLTVGEEKARPVINGETTPISSAPDVPTVTGSAYVNGRIEITFTAPSRTDVSYQFQFIATADVGTGVWLDMGVQMGDGLAYSPAISSGVAYSYRYRSVTASGFASAWSAATAFSGSPEETIVDGQVPV